MNAISHFLISWLVTSIIFFTGDILWIGVIARKFYVSSLKQFMHTNAHGPYIIMQSALIAYILLSFALTWFIVAPLKMASHSSVFLNGTLLGLCIYGIYDFTNHATLAHWPISLLVVDIVWGSLWCGIASTLSQYIITCGRNLF